MEDTLRRALLEGLGDHRPMGRAEAGHLERMRSFAQEATDPFDRAAEAGHFTASALVVSRDLDQVLLLHHRKLDRWLQCGGHFEPDDPDPASAALREAQEETGLDGLHLHPLWDDLLDVDVHTIPAGPKMGDHPHLDLRYLVVADQDAPLDPAAEEVKALEWLPWAEANRRIDDPGLRRLLTKLEAMRSILPLGAKTE